MSSSTTHWIVDGNNVFGSRPDGWWNDRPAAMIRFAQQVAEWARSHDDEVVVVFDPPVPPEAADLAGGNLAVRSADRRGRDAADDTIVRISRDWAAAEDAGEIVVVSSDRGLRTRLPELAMVMGAGAFLERIEA